MKAETSRIPLPSILVAEPCLSRGGSSDIFQVPELVHVSLGRSTVVAEPGMCKVPEVTRSSHCSKISRVKAVMLSLNRRPGTSESS